jgi:hypothetical protein
MRLPIIALAAALSAFAAQAQQSPASPPPQYNEPEVHPIPGLSSEHTTVTIAPDPSATPMADPQSAAEYGSPSAVESPGSPMPNTSAWPTPQASAKRPKWLKKAPTAAPAAPPADSAAQAPH